jgi:hypothetical protein
VYRYTGDDGVPGFANVPGSAMHVLHAMLSELANAVPRIDAVTIEVVNPRVIRLLRPFKFKRVNATKYGMWYALVGDWRSNVISK